MLRVNKTLLLFTRLDQDLEKDYYFGSPSASNMADLRWFALGLGSAGQDFSLGFWFRYFRNGGRGTILAMYAERYVYQISFTTPSNSPFIFSTEPLIFFNVMLSLHSTHFKRYKKR